MKALFPHSLLSRFAAAVGLATGLLAGAAAPAAMLQQPLQAGGGGVPPNLVFTLDDSGSMWWECLPDSLCTSGSNGLEAIPKRNAVSTANRLGTVVYDDVPVKDGSTTTWTATPVLLSRRMRASAYNPLYYNPAVEYKPWLKGDGTRWPNASPTAAPVLAGATATQNLTGVQTVTSKWCSSLSSCWDPRTQAAHIARYYNMAGTGANTTDFTLVKIESSNNSYPKAVGRTDCAGSTCTYAEEIQNFANWYTYYRTRALTAIGGTAEAFAAVPEDYRVGYGRINKTSATSIDGKSIATLERGVRGFSAANKNQFYTWLSGRTQPSGSTPLRRAMDDVGQYFSWSDNRGPWGADPGTNDTTAHSTCRRSVHLLMTDGMWNKDQGGASTATGNIDGASGSTITGPGGQSYTYSAVAPYKDNHSSTLADVAMYYWKNDLRPDLDNAIKPILTAGRENPAFWQHMVNFTIAFGVSGNLKNPDDLAALTSGAKSWGNPNSDGPDTVDDLWHAALNSRGRALSARNSVEYSAAIKSIIDEMTAMEGSEAGVGVSTTTLPPVGSSTKMYTPSFAAPSWVGEVEAQTIDEKGLVTGSAWKAASQLPGHASRRIFTYDPAATPKGVEFKWSLLSNTLKTELWGGTTGGEPLVDYLRGSGAGEGSTYRKRENQDGTPNKLGDIVNSTPALVHDLVNSFYEYLPAQTPSQPIDYGAGTYRRFMAAKKLREAQLLVGANDGMLHAFRDSDGVESFAFMPRSVLGSVKQLWNTDYAHRYFVDGPIYETDAYDQANGRWQNLVQGFGGAGGKYLYTVRMPVANWTTGSTPPTALSASASAPGATDILWEINDQTTGFGELGYVLTKPETGVMRDGTWVTIFGNGYESSSRKAQLFIVNALTGALIKRIDTNVGNAATPNGLGGVGVVRDSQQRIVAAYGGDLQGNMWKFDLSSASVADWKIAFDGQPLFVARNASTQLEPITAKPNFRAFPTGGVMVLFGTGKLFEQGDQLANDRRTLYGIWDRVPVGSGPGTSADALTNSTTLVTQNVVTAPLAGSIGAVYRKLTVTPVDYQSKRGWRLPLVIANGERMLDEPQMRVDAVFMQTLTPTAVADECQAAKLIRRGYILDPFMSGTARPPFDGNADGTRESHIVDLEGSGENQVVMQTPKCTGPQCGSGGGGASGGGGEPCGVILGAGTKGSIQACFGKDAVKRHWRQIVTPPAS